MKAVISNLENLVSVNCHEIVDIKRQSHVHLHIHQTGHVIVVLSIFSCSCGSQTMFKSVGTVIALSYRCSDSVYAEIVSNVFIEFLTYFSS